MPSNRTYAITFQLNTEYLEVVSTHVSAPKAFNRIKRLKDAGDPRNLNVYKCRACARPADAIPIKGAVKVLNEDEHTKLFFSSPVIYQGIFVINTIKGI